MINLTSSNPSLSSIALLQSPNNWVNLEARHLPEDEKQTLFQALSRLNATAFEAIENKEAIQVASVQYKNQAFQRTYPMSLYATDDSETYLAIKLGQQVFPIHSLEGIDVEISEVVLEKWANLTFVCTFEIDDELVILPLPLRLNEEAYNGYKADPLVFTKKLQMALKKAKYDAIANVLLVATEGQGGSNGIPTVDIKSLPEQTEFSVIASKEVETQYGKSFVLTIMLNDDSKVNVWAPNNTKQALILGAKIGLETKLSYTTWTRGSKICVDGKLTNLDIPQTSINSNLADLFAF